MSLYNMMNGFNPACVFIMPMLGRKQEEYPRFRDCFVTEENNIAIYTRVGGGNRGCGFGEEELYKDENFLRDAEKILSGEISSALEIPSTEAIRYLRNKLKEDA